MQKSSPENVYYGEEFDSLQDNCTEWAGDFRSHGMKVFSDIGLPLERRGNEKWKYTNVGPVAKNKYRIANSVSLPLDEVKNSAPWHESWTNIVFVNGKFRSDLSNFCNVPGVKLTNISDEIEKKSPSQMISEYLGRTINITDDGFAALNTAFLSDGVAIEIEKDSVIDVPVNIVFFNNGSENTVSHPRVLVVARPNSFASIIESYVGGSASTTLTNSVSEIFVGEGAQIRHYRLLSESDQTFDIGYGRVKLDKDSVFNSRTFFKGSDIGRYDLEVLVDGEGASCDLQGLYFTSNSQHMDNFVNIDHSKPNGTSNLFYKGILDGRSKAVFGGTVLVRQAAQKTDSVQSDKNLLLSPHAEVDSKPALFIYADDVKCAHGATAGNIDADTVFYMRSRGVDIETASKLLIYGFAGEIIDKVEIVPLKEYLEQIFLNSLPSYRFEF